VPPSLLARADEVIERVAGDGATRIDETACATKFRSNALIALVTHDWVRCHNVWQRA
jgi:hypothetical protein